MKKLFKLFRQPSSNEDYADAPIDWEAKFKTAATDLAKQAEEIADLRNEKQAFSDAIGELNAENAGLRGDVAAAEKAADDFKRKLIAAEHEIAAYSNGAKILHDAIDDLTPDAQKWRNARDKRAKNRGGGK